MEKTVEAVGRVIETMRANLGEPLTVDDMAREVMFSKFHFSRFFQRVTGVSPGRFLSAMRLQEAKELLVTTTLTVTEISHRVGYTSVGTFSSRFTMSVGVSPTTYRQLGGFRTPNAAGPSSTSSRRTVSAPGGPTVCGEVVSALPDTHLGLVFVGLFADPIPQGQPVRCAILHRTGPFLLDKVPHGTWYLLAHSVAAGLEGAVSAAQNDDAEADQTICVGAYGPVRIGPDSSVQQAEVRLEPMVEPDPAVLKALLDIRSVALTVGAA
jgi:AraC family transcriptional regulator